MDLPKQPATSPDNLPQPAPRSNGDHSSARPRPLSGRAVGLAALALVAVIAVAAYFRFTGLMWGDYSYPHPDERFLVWVTADISPVHSLGEYFNTAISSLNPANRGHAFYVYGDLPVILTRYLTNWLSPAQGWQEVLQTGRALSALFDLFTVLLVYLIAERLCGWKIATLAGLFSAAAVLQIQQAHFYTTDSFSTALNTLAVYLGVLIATENGAASRRVLGLSLWFGLAVGLAMACKINTVLVAALLPVGLAAIWLRAALRSPAARSSVGLTALALRLAAYAVAAGVVAFLVFRITQPYAFSGPGFFNFLPDKSWMDSMRNLQAQSTGDVDFPPALQWASRTHLFSLENMLIWGLGIPLGVMGWIGFFLFAWRALRHLFGYDALPVTVTGPSFDTAIDPPAHRQGTLHHANLLAMLEGAWPGLLILWAWTGVYFVWQSMAWNSTMRYQLPIYPTLAILAAWGLGSLWAQPFPRFAARLSRRQAWQAGVGVMGALVLLLTLAWAFAFTRIYTRPETRVAASRWIYDNVPGAVNLSGTAAGKPWQQLAAVRSGIIIRANAPYLSLFDNEQSGALTVIHLPQIRVSASGTAEGELRLRARLFDPAQPAQDVAVVESALPSNGNLDKLDLPVPGLIHLDGGKRYALALEIVTGAGQNQRGQAVSLPITVNLDGAVTIDLYGRSQTAIYQSAAGNPARLMLDSGGTLTQMRIASTQPEASASPPAALLIYLEDPLTNENLTATAITQPGSTQPVLVVSPPLKVKPGETYIVSVQPDNPSQPLDASQQVLLDFLDDPTSQWLPTLTPLSRPDDPLFVVFNTQADSGTLDKVSFAHLAQADPTVQGATGVTLNLYNQSNPGKPVATSHLSANLSTTDPRGGPQSFTFNPPVTLHQNQAYTFNLIPDRGALAVRGSAIGNESTWDMGLPFRLDNYDPFGGLYTGDLFEMYWDDTADKYNRFVNILDQSDYLAFSSNRHWGTTTRVPARYPLTTEFYRRLLGCPPDKDVVWCYRVAEVGTFKGELGYDLVAVQTSYPNLGPLRINDQFAEEAFTVYDHAKVMIFKKRADYNPAQTRLILGAVDLNKVVHLTPHKAADYKDLLLPTRLWLEQQAGGAWAKLFPPSGLLNAYPVVGLLAWYVFLFLLGLLAYPVIRMALPGLPDRGYALARTAGMVLFAYLAWIGGSAGIPVTRLYLLAVFVLLATAGMVLALLQRGELAQEWKTRRGYFLAVELAALLFFAIELGIRLGNPDLWHPIFGGEKPMDFSFFNAVMKSTVFPPYDPWFAGGYINYYYYGFVLVGMPVKLLGINPTVAYNLVLPALFMLVGLGAYGVGANLWLGLRREGENTFHTADAAADESPALEASEWSEPALEALPNGIAEDHAVNTPLALRKAVWAGLVATLFLLLLGNLGTVRMIWQGWQKLVVSDEVMLQGNMGQHISWAAQGLAKQISGQADHLPYYVGDWYWKPSRAIEPESGNEITEFPLFTFLYADLHAHLMALPVTLLVLAWALAVLLGRGRWGLADGRYHWLSLGLALLLGALAAGALRPANTWDQYTYLALGAISLGYAQFRAVDLPRRSLTHLLWTVLPVLALVGLAVLLYRPFDAWFAQGYNSLELWQGARTNLPSYLVHWGLFLFVITAWLFDESVDWMAATPLSSLKWLRVYREAIFGVLALLAALVGILLLQGVVIALVAVPLGIWVTLLLFRPRQPVVKRAVLFMIGTALALTLAVELVAVKGDIGRMNTVFKFYYQAWTLLALSAAAALVWLWPRLRVWAPTARGIWTVALALLVAGAALFPLTAVRAKIDDRMTPGVPLTLDGMAYMNYSRYTDGLTAENTAEMDLSQDYRAIHWMQQNVSGSPVIVEANTPEYRHWGTRFTIYTGLPGVVGWNWHERQQRTVTPDTWVYERIDAVRAFYLTGDPAAAREFLTRYNVRYIIVGQLERIWYPGPGLDKFTQLNGVLWDQVYKEGSTVIYRVK